MTSERAQPQAALIGVTGPDRGGFAAWIFTRWALSRAGARAVRVTPARAIDPEALDGASTTIYRARPSSRRDPDGQPLARGGRPARLLVNSLHFHAVGEAGRDMRIVAREGSGVPQAIEHLTRSFWIGVQWHPEYLPHHRAHQALFRHLVTQAQQTRALRVSRQARR